MSTREANQRWLATMGLDDESIRRGKELHERAQRMREAHGARPPWWRPLARWWWDRWMAGVERRAFAAMRAGTGGQP